MTAIRHVHHHTMSFHQVAEMTELLEDWQPMPPDKSLALLDVNVADPTVRRFAVRCLQQARYVPCVPYRPGMHPSRTLQRLPRTVLNSETSTDYPEQH